MGGFKQTMMDDFLPLRDVVFRTLRQAILTGEMKPGERLLEIHLANKLAGSFSSRLSPQHTHDVIKNTHQHACQKYQCQHTHPRMLRLEEPIDYIKLGKEDTNWRHTKNTDNTQQPEQSGLRNLHHHAMNSHHILCGILLHNGTSHIEQRIFYQSMVEHMKQSSLHSHRNENTQASHHKAEILHRGISQHSLHISLNQNKGNSRCYSQQAKAKTETTYKINSDSRKQNNNVSHQYIDGTYTE